MRNSYSLWLALVITAALVHAQAQPASPKSIASAPVGNGFTDAAAFGFSPENSGSDNASSLQRAVDQGGTIVVSRPGTYLIAGTVYLGSHTSLIFGNNVFVKKVAERGFFANVLLNKGALTKAHLRQSTRTSAN